MAAVDYLVRAIDEGLLDHPRPIGFYFAKLWYYERLYPAVFGLSALGLALRYRVTVAIEPDQK
jgi:squalene-hopene/tetraprenyl-beta-curcumene cyclase